MPVANVYLYVNYLYVLVLSRRFSEGRGELSRRFSEGRGELSRRFSEGRGELSRRFSEGRGELSRRFSEGQRVEVDRAAKARPALTAAVTVSAL